MPKSSKPSKKTQPRAPKKPAPSKRTLIRESDITLADLGERAHIMPGEDPHLTITVNTISSNPHEMRARIIPVCEPLLAGNEEKYLLRTVQTNWISSAGKFITDFENLFAEKVGAKYGVACSNGTTALHLALARWASARATR